MVYLQLIASIVFEVIGTSLLKKAEGFSNFPVTVLMLFCYGLSFYFVSHVAKVLPIGVVYATWSGLGIVLISILAYFLYKQALDFPAILGIGFIVAGVFLINVVSKVSTH